MSEIKARREYIAKHLDKSIEKKLNYDWAVEYLNKMSFKYLEVFDSVNTSIVYSSPYSYLNSDKNYKLSNLVDNNKNTA